MPLLMWSLYYLFSISDSKGLLISFQILGVLLILISLKNSWFLNFIIYVDKL